jgi:hypothetical protein
MLKYILIIAQIIVLIALGILLWQIWRKFKSIPEDEVIGEERADYMRRRLTWVAICAIAEDVLQIASAILRFVEAL